ncbi:MAG TPA: M48 family metalloprotease, partial [Candidatus Bathyarchaeia archaeon]|nr:M48 family metalloprotease [Candidatus Bathyarchaeia archaeon]
MLALLVCAQGESLSQSSSVATPASKVSRDDSANSPAHTISEDTVSGSLARAGDVQAEVQAAATSAAGSTPASASIPAKSLASVPNTAVHSPQPAKFDVTQIGQRNVASGINFYSIDREIAVGRDLAKQVEQFSKLVTDLEITDYINRIGQNLVRNSDARVPFTIKVVDSGEVNAFALPGGFFYVDSGLILAADNEAELAAIMAHEIAHVAARHATKNMTKQQIWNMASIPLMFVGGP